MKSYPEKRCNRSPVNNRIMVAIKPETPLVVMLLSMMIACSDQSGFDSEIEVCTTAERAGLLEPAVEACSRALEVAEARRLPPTAASLALYRLGRLKRQQGEFADAEALLGRSLAIEEQQNNSGPREIGNRLFELSLSLAGQKRWTEGAQILVRLIPLAGEFPEKERMLTANILRHYSRQLSRAGQPRLTEPLATGAAALQH